MRVLHVVTLVSPTGAFGGPTRVALEQVRELRARGHHVDLVAGWLGAGPPPAAVDGVAVTLFPLRRVLPAPAFTGLASVAMLRWLGRRVAGYDVGHVHTARDLVSLGALLLLRRAGTPYVTQTHGMVVPDGRRAVRALDALAVRRLLAGAAERLVLNATEARQIGQVTGGAGSRRIVNGVPPAPPAARPRADPPEVLFCARLEARKRPVAFVELAAVLLAGGLDARFTLVGPDEGCAGAVERRIRDLDLTGRVTYEGPVPYEAVAARLGRAAVFVLPSVDEPFGLTLIEALRLGIPSVTTASCGLAPALTAAGAALVTDGSPAALATAVGAAVRDPALRDDLSARGRALVETTFSARHVGDVLDDTYARACGAPGRRTGATPGGR